MQQLGHRHRARGSSNNSHQGPPPIVARPRQGLRCGGVASARPIVSSSSNGFVGHAGSAPPHLSLSTTTPKHLTTASGDDLPPSNVSFWLKFKTSWGQGVKLIGSHPKLGSWTLEKAVELRWAEGDFWTAAVPLPRGAVYEYKYVVIDFNTKQAVMWQTGANSVLAVDMDEAQLDVHDNWGNDPGAEVRTDGQGLTREDKLQKWASTLVTKYKNAVQETQQLVQWAEEGKAIKGELTRVKMELGLMQQAQRESDLQVTALKQQNSRLQQELVHARQELNASFAEALSLLTDDWDATDTVSSASTSEASTSSTSTSMPATEDKSAGATRYSVSDATPGFFDSAPSTPRAADTRPPDGNGNSSGYQQQPVPAGKSSKWQAMMGGPVQNNISPASSSGSGYGSGVSNGVPSSLWG